ncbi:hypothetical protein KI387_043688 [Taxus chinensis]|uniref:Uncharacterized protein n=1 Tax=Taxus chinensis TaxID=29808 RepID=A0AA38LSM3_TAXCH|nr:hypothetical protein KI387_043688 [Taxus chinensis]
MKHVFINESTHIQKRASQRNWLAQWNLSAQQNIDDMAADILELQESTAQLEQLNLSFHQDSKKQHEALQREVVNIGHRTASMCEEVSAFSYLLKQMQKEQSLLIKDMITGQEGSKEQDSDLMFAQRICSSQLDTVSTNLEKVRKYSKKIRVSQAEHDSSEEESSSARQLPPLVKYKDVQRHTPKPRVAKKKESQQKKDDKPDLQILAVQEEDEDWLQHARNVHRQQEPPQGLAAIKEEEPSSDTSDYSSEETEEISISESEEATSSEPDELMAMADADIKMEDVDDELNWPPILGTTPSTG